MTMDTEHGEMARIIGDVRRAERERDAATERAERAEAQHATVLASLEHALAQGDALNAEAKDMHDRAAAAEVRATVAERVRDDLRVIAERQVDDIEGATVRIRRIERERDDLAATLETRNAEHALAMARVAELEAIIAGRTTPPTDAELEAHSQAHPPGLWVTRDGGGNIVAECGLRRLAGLRREHEEEGSEGTRWIPADAAGRPCAWPVASEGGAS
jgi:chromosome segregation ATPase